MATIYKLDHPGSATAVTVHGAKEPGPRLQRAAALDVWLLVTGFNTPHTFAADILDALRQVEEAETVRTA